MRLKTNPETQRANLSLLMDTQITLYAMDFKFNITEVLSKSRKQKTVFERACLAFYFRSQGYSTLKVGQILNRDHATILHLLKYGNRKYHSSWNHRKYNEFIDLVEKLTTNSKIQHHEEQIKFHLKELQKLRGTKAIKMSLEL